MLSQDLDANDRIPIAVRLIDICVHLMSGEHTCHHRYVQYLIYRVKYTVCMYSVRNVMRDYAQYV